MLLVAVPASAAAQNSLFIRRYEVGQQIGYRMTGVNSSPQKKISYSADAIGAVGLDKAGRPNEQLGWSHLVANGKPVLLSPGSVAFRQTLSLTPGYWAPFPDLSRLDSSLVGPITDLLTFYVDLQLAARASTLVNPGDHFLFKFGIPVSWADGRTVLVGQDSVDFDITLRKLDRKRQTAEIQVMHIPPQNPGLRLEADWMKAPIASGPNNWVQVEKSADGTFIAGIGRETFDVRIDVSLGDGRILFAKEDNIVDVSERVCADSTLTSPGPAKRYRITRHIEIRPL